MLSEAQRFWDAIAGKVRRTAQDESKNALRMERYSVTTAPNGTTIGVTLPLGSKELSLPYSSDVSSANVGDTVLVAWWGSMSNAKVYYFADGYRGINTQDVFPVGAIFESQTYYTTQQLSAMFGGTWSQANRAVPVFYRETFTITLESISPGYAESATDYDISGSQYASACEAIGIVGYGVTGTSFISVNRVLLDPEALTVSYLLRNNATNATPSTRVTFAFTVLWQGYAGAYRWERTA